MVLYIGFFLVQRIKNPLLQYLPKLRFSLLFICLNLKCGAAYANTIITRLSFFLF